MHGRIQLGEKPDQSASVAQLRHDLNDTYRKITKRIAPSKPMILAEIASTGSPKSKSKWIRDMFKMLATKYRSIRALIWFNQVDRNIDWPLDTSPAAASA